MSDDTSDGFAAMFARAEQGVSVQVVKGSASYLIAGWGAAAEGLSHEVQ